MALAPKTSGESWISRIVSFAAFTTATFGDCARFSGAPFSALAGAGFTFFSAMASSS